MTTRKFKELLSQFCCTYYAHIMHCYHNSTENYFSSRYYKYYSNCSPREEKENSLNLISNHNNVTRTKCKHTEIVCVGNVRNCEFTKQHRAEGLWGSHILIMNHRNCDTLITYKISNYVTLRIKHNNPNQTCACYIKITFQTDRRKRCV